MAFEKSSKEKRYALSDYCFGNTHSFYPTSVEFLTGLRRAAVWRRKHEEARFDLVLSRDAGRQRHRAHEIYLSFQPGLGRTGSDGRVCIHCHDRLDFAKTFLNWKACVRMPGRAHIVLLDQRFRRVARI